MRENEKKIILFSGVSPCGIEAINPADNAPPFESPLGALLNL